MEVDYSLANDYNDRLQRREVVTARCHGGVISGSQQTLVMERKKEHIASMVTWHFSYALSFLK